MNLMGFVSMLGGWQDIDMFKTNGAYSWVGDLFTVLYPLLYAIMAITAAAGMIYAVYLGINLARAEDQSKRDEAKKRLITTIIAVAVVVALVLFFNEILPAILKSFKITEGGTSGLPGASFIHL